MRLRFNKRIFYIFPLLTLGMIFVLHYRSAPEAAERPEESFTETNAGLILPTATPTRTSTARPPAVTQTGSAPSQQFTATPSRPVSTNTPEKPVFTPTQTSFPTITLTPRPTSTLAPTATPSSTPRSPGAGPVTVTRDIQYLYVEGYPASFTSLDIYTPGAGGDLPVVIFIHGGSWREGDKGDTGLFDDVFTRSGYVFISTNYRLYPNANYRTQAQDVASSIAWVHENIAAYGGDPERIYLLGYSAGAHLAALVSTKVGFMLETGLDTTVIDGVIVLDTLALDLPLLGWTGAIPDDYAQIFGTEEQGWINASPINHIVSGRYVPPMAVAWSGGDAQGLDPLRAQIANSFIKRLGEVGVLVLPVNAISKSHEKIASDFGKPGDAVTAAVFEFLQQTGAPGLVP